MLAARQRPQPLWAMRKVHGLFLSKARVCLELTLIQKPDAIYGPSQVARATASILGIGHDFPTCELGGVVDQQAGTGVGGVVGGHGLQGIDNGALLLTDVLLEATQLTETVHNDQARLHECHQ